LCRTEGGFGSFGYPPSLLYSSGVFFCSHNASGGGILFDVILVLHSCFACSATLFDSSCVMSLIRMMMTLESWRCRVRGLDDVQQPAIHGKVYTWI
jgi:hypothetical protein